MRNTRLASVLQIVLAILVGYIIAVLLPPLEQDLEMTNLAPLRLQKAVNLAQRLANRAPRSVMSTGRNYDVDEGENSRYE